MSSPAGPAARGMPVIHRIFRLRCAEVREQVVVPRSGTSRGAA
ncbi:hypothetical protein ACVGOW_18760 [Pseudonocardia saturnea]